MKNQHLHILCLPFLATLTMNAFAAGYEIPLEAASQIGTALSGEAALGQDASTGFYNPAGLTLLKNKQFVGSLTGVSNMMRYKGNVTAASGASPFFNYSATDQNVTLKAQGLVPALHFAMPVREDTVVAIGVIAPYGLGIVGPRNSSVRYSMEKNSLEIMDFTPSVGFKVNDQFSVGLGLDAVFAVQSIQNAIRLGPIDDGKLELRTRGWGYGWHGGLMYQALPTTRIGLVYHSFLQAQTSGYSLFTLPGGATIQSHNLKGHNIVPPTTAVGFVHTLNNQWDLMATLKYQQWSKVGFSKLYNIVTPAGTTNSVTNLRYKNTRELSVGTRYTMDEHWQIGAGTGYIETPTNNGARSLYFIDAARFLVTLGVRYQPNHSSAFDLGFGHYFFRSAPINYVGNDGTTATGKGQNAANAIGFQYTQNFA